MNELNGPWVSKNTGWVADSTGKEIFRPVGVTTQLLPVLLAAPEMAEALRNFIGFAEYHELEKRNPRLQLQLIEMRRALAKAGV